MYVVIILSLLVSSPMYQLKSTKSVTHDPRSKQNISDDANDPISTRVLTRVIPWPAFFPPYNSPVSVPEHFRWLLGCALPLSVAPSLSTSRRSHMIVPLFLAASPEMCETQMKCVAGLLSVVRSSSNIWLYLHSHTRTTEIRDWGLTDHATSREMRGI